ncbi:MraZ C-terminal domain-containing protein [Clostridium aestuarii]
MPQNLLEYANPKKEIVSIRVINRLKIWSKKKWDKYNNLNVDFN